ncbi:hypothetical protein GCM10027284_28310 [Cyclobacterium sediminis]
MKNSKTTLLSYLALIVLVMTLNSSCVNEQIEESTQQITPTGETIDDLVVSAFFDWETTEELTVSIEGLPVDVGVYQRLSLTTDAGREIFGGMHRMNEDFEMSFDLPKGVGEVRMKYGAFEKVGTVVGRKVSFDFFIEDNASDIES